MTLITDKEREMILDEYIRDNREGLRLERPVIAWDLDSTVRSTVHRRYLIPVVGINPFDPGELADERLAQPGDCL